MKFIYLLIVLLSSLILASCEKNNNVNENQNLSQENGNRLSYYKSGDKHARRISYADYIKEYNINDEQNNSNTSFLEIDESNDEIVSEDEGTLSNISNEETNIPNNQLAAYSTPLLASSKERVNNLKIVCERLNNFILKPNETFSYNNVTGPYGADNGFEKATILLSDGTKTQGYGGGVCQLSSTLYNVVKNIDNIEITERHHHSAPVAYVPEGEDATISLQSGLDFKFTNKNDFPIRFKATCENWKVNVWAYKEF